MAIDNIFGGGDLDRVADNVFSAVSDSVSEVKAMQKRKAAENVQIVVQALKKIESDLQDKYDNVTTVIEKRVASIKDGKDGQNGANGRDGKDGRPGRDTGRRRADEGRRLLLPARRCAGRTSRGAATRSTPSRGGASANDGPPRSIEGR